jgi:hypothetical protein
MEGAGALDIALLTRQKGAEESRRNFLASINQQYGRMNNLVQFE